MAVHLAERRDLTHAPPVATPFLLFVYGVFLEGEPQHGALARARPLGRVATEATFDLVDLGQEPALVGGGTTAVQGELYEVAAADLAAIDVHHGHPLRYRRGPVRLVDGRVVDAHTITPDQSRGRRRIRSGDWKTRLSGPSLPDHAWSRFARQRGKAPR